MGVVKKRTYHPSRLKTQNAPDAGQALTLQQKAILDSRKKSVEAFKNAKTQGERDAILRMRNSREAAQRSMFGDDPNSIARKIREGKIIDPKAPDAADLEARARASQGKAPARVRTVDPNRMREQNAPIGERPTSEARAEQKLAKAREAYQRAVDNPRSTPESVARAQDRYNRANDEYDRATGRDEASLKAAETKAKTSADFAREAKAADDEFRSKMREADKIADEQIRRNDVNYREDEAKQLVREANEADRRRVTAEREASKLKDAERTAKENRDLNAAKSLVDQKAEAARTFAEARALDQEMERVNAGLASAEKRAKRAGFTGKKEQEYQKLRDRREAIAKRREALKKSGAPAMWGDQPRNELGQFWFK